MRSLFSILILCLFTSPVLAQEFKKLRVVTSNYPPYQGQKLPQGGVFDNLALLLLKEAGYRVELVYRPWARTVKEARSGEADAILGMWQNDERKEWFEFSPPLVENPLVLVCLGQHTFCKNNPELLGKRVGLVIGYGYPKEIMARITVPNWEVEEETNFKMLVGQRIDFMLVDRGVAYYLAHQMGMQNKIKVLDPPIAVLNLHIAFSKNSFMGQAAWLEINRAMKQAEQNGLIKPLRLEASNRGIKILQF